MSNFLRVIFAPILSLSLLEVLTCAALVVTLYALSRRVPGAVLRGLVFSFILIILANPSMVEEQRSPLKDIVLLLVDDTNSMGLGDRLQQSASALSSLTKKLEDYADLEIDTLHLQGTSETDLFRALEAKLSVIPKNRLAGIIAITDGEVHDALQTAAPLPAPLHVLLVGHHNEIDRRLVIKQAPAYGMVGKRVTLVLRVDDYPKTQSDHASVVFRRDDGSADTFTMPVGKDLKFDVPIDHAGPNLYAFSAEPLPHELTTINNNSAVTISGIRDRLRVLLISGEPHIGGRTWRNFLKSDPAVDLIHFTILRSPNKLDGTPSEELALIAFPIHELFEVKLKSFDLVIFDQFRRQSLIPDDYLENIATYVEQGGALLISNATDETISQLALSPLARILPAEPTGHLLTGSFVPDLTPAGVRHPVTSTLTHDVSRKDWGPWFRQLDARATKGEVLMSGINNAPLLVLSHVGKGRVAQFLSDQFWLWARGFRGGGPQADLLKRTAHWLVGEPELDETALKGRTEMTKQGWQLVITKQSLHDESTTVSVTDPENQQLSIVLKPGTQPGLLEATDPVSKTGLYHLHETNGDTKKDVLVMVGPVNEPEFGDMHATEEKLSDAVRASGGGIFWLDDRPDGPDIKRTTGTHDQSGWNWIGLKHNDQYRITGSKAYPLWPAWLGAIILLGFCMITWRREGH